MSDAIVTERLTKQYRAWHRRGGVRTAVSELDLRVPAGGITGLLGPNGAGKTTVARLLLGLARPTGGRATVLGRDSTRDSLAVRGDVAFVPEERAIFGWMKAGDLIAHIAALSPEWDATLAARLVTAWSLDPRARLRELSLGTRGRLLLLVALARRAALLVLDEPTAGLDPTAVEETLSELAAASADGATILLVTHRLEEVERICDRVVVMMQGCAVLQGDLDELRAAWCTIDVAGHPDPGRMRTWAEVATVTPYGEHARLLVRGGASDVVERVRLVGAEVTNVRPLSLREIYLATTQRDGADASSDHLA